MKKLIIGLVLVALLATAVSCGAPETGDKAPLGPPYTMDVEMVPPVAVSESLSIFPFGGGGGEPAEVVVPTTVPEEQMIVRTADMTLIVADIAQTIEDTAQLAEGFNGYVVSSRMSGDEDKLRGWITIRVPDDKFDEAMADHEQGHRDLAAKHWRQGRRMLADVSEEIRVDLIERWNSSSVPPTAAYFADFVRCKLRDIVTRIEP